MIKSKVFYAERVIRSLQNDYPNIDWRIDEREIFPALDDVVNMLARKAYFENWKTTGASIDEQYITRFDNIPVVDPVDEDGEPTGQFSYLELPANYVDLPRNGGINEVYPMDTTEEGQQAVIIISHSDYRTYQRQMAGSMEQRLTAYPKGNRLEFTRCGVKAQYGDTFSVALVIRDASQISDDAPYPIPANYEGFVIDTVVKQFVDKRAMPIDNVRDKLDSPA